MKLFQGSVFRNFLSGYDESEAKRAFEVYKSEFMPKIKNIKSSKEEQYQYGFLDDLFVKVLGYTLNPSPDFNLTTELKNTTDSKKADGAIIKNDTVVGVIELKSTKTKTMEKIVAQAFGYKHSHEGCRYVITSNFEKLRFYIDYSDRFIEFNLFALEWEDFLKFYYLLSWKSIENNTPIKLKEASKVEEENISNELYKKYSKLRENLFANLVKNNPQIDKLTLLNKTQTLLDRMVFIFFAEDRGILPTNTIRAIIEHYQNDIEDRPLYHFYKIYFRAINEGNSKLKIQAYNGGLFEIDEILQSLIIDDDVLDTLPQELSKYDFNSDIDVNILGHIFENSLSDIEEFRAKIQDENFDFKLSKRKKDGVFYTPEFITKYIVKNTVGKLCEAKKEELGLADIEIKIPKNPKKLTKNEQKIEENLKKYRDFLLNLKILDPACGSGAFLNQALNFLLEEHSFIDEGIRTLMGGNVLGLFDIKKDILENNLYGVDINSEAVEIAKLSLWLRTVESGRKLNRLSGKIKVGNSLISDKTVAKNAFVWEEEFPEVFEQGGFDVVIGNPPYVDSENMTKNYSEDRKWIAKNYIAAKGNWDIFVPFFERGLNILKNDGLLSFIIPNKVLSAKYASKLRDFINAKFSIKEIVDLSKNNIFTEASVYPVILFLQKKEQSRDIKITSMPKGVFSSGCLKYKYEENWALYINPNYHIYSKISSTNKSLSEFDFIKIYSSASVSEAYEIKDYIRNNKFPTKEEMKLINTGTIDPYIFLWGKDYLQYLKGKYLFPTILKKNIKNKEWTYKGKIAIAGMALRLEACIDLYGEYLPLKSTVVITAKNSNILRIMLAILNSKLITFIFRVMNSTNSMAGGYLNINQDNIGKIPIPQISEDEQKPFVEKAEIMLKLHEDFHSKKQKFLKRLKSNFELDKLSKKLENFYDYDFATMLKELKKKKITLKLTEQDEWEEYFESYKKELENLQHQINQTDQEIDKMVYELYGLSEEEIRVVEGV